MGGCVSTPKSCVGAKLRSSKRRKSRRRRKIQRKRAAVSSRLSDGSFDNLDHHHRNFSNPSSRGLSFLRLSVSSAFDWKIWSWFVFVF